MNYKRCKVYHDGSHYIGIPEGNFPHRSRPRKASPEEDEYADGLDAAKKAYFEELYGQYQDCTEREQREKIAADMLPFFESIEESTSYVDAQFDRKKRNLICRRMRAFRRANLQPLNYFVTLTYDDQLHTEESFRKRLKETLSRFASRKGWRYMGVWERGGNTACSTSRRERCRGFWKRLQISTPVQSECAPLCKVPISMPISGGQTLKS